MGSESVRGDRPLDKPSDALTGVFVDDGADLDRAALLVGIELEVSQRFFAAGGEPWRTVRTVLIDSLAAVLGLSRTD